MLHQLLILGIFSVALVQCSVPLPRHEAVTLELDSELTGILDDLKQKVSEAIASAGEQLSKLGDEIQKQATEIIEKVKEKLNAESGDLLKQLQVLKDEAVKLGIDIKDCVIDKEQELKDLPVNFGKKIYQCGVDKVNEGKIIVEKAKADIQASIDNVKALAKEFDACSDLSWYNAIACQAEAGANIVAAATSIPLSISQSVTDAINLLSTIHVDLEKCAVDRANQAVAEGEKLFTEIGECIKNKVNPQN